jgi:hypothetical protein
LNTKHFPENGTDSAYYKCRLPPYTPKPYSPFSVNDRVPPPGHFFMLAVFRFPLKE